MTKQAAASRVVLLGASNLARAISTVVATAGATAGRPSRYYIACGHGRSFGLTTCMCGRSLPGILPCALWDDLKSDADSAAPTRALITDIGNDLLYGSSPETILDWVDTCARRLRDHGARIVVTKLPIASVERVGPRRFLLLRKVLFSASRATLEDIRRHMVTINTGLESLAATHGAALVDHDLGWYGFDPIHIRMRHWRSAYEHIFSHWLDDGEPRPTYQIGGLRRWLYLRSLRPYERRMFRRRQTQAQPAGRLPDGSAINLY